MMFEGIGFRFIEGIQGSTEGGFLPSAEAEADGAKKLRLWQKTEAKRFK